MFLLIVTCLLGQLWQWFDYTNPDISRLHPTVSSHQVQCLWVWESANHIRVQTVSFFQLIVCPSSACSSSSCSSLCLSCSAVGAPFVGCFCCSPALCLLSSAVVCCSCTVRLLRVGRIVCAFVACVLIAHLSVIWLPSSCSSSQHATDKANIIHSSWDYTRGVSSHRRSCPTRTSKASDSCRRCRKCRT